jgi:hypothetical protein
MNDDRLVAPLPSDLRSLRPELKPGRYTGSLRTTSLADYYGRRLTRRERLFGEKAWVWISGSDERVSFGGAIVDVGYAGKAFFWTFDHQTETLTDRSATLLPFQVDVSSTFDGVVASTSGPKARLRIERSDGCMTCKGAIDGLAINLTYDTTRTSALTAVAPVHKNPDGVHMTEKMLHIPVQGWLEAQGNRFTLTDGRGASDFSHGLLGRETSWHWALGSGRLRDGRNFGFNFVEGFNESLENAFWVEGSIYGSADVSIDFDPSRPREPWTVRSADGNIGLTLTVKGLREEDTNLGIVSSRYSQPLGYWSGAIHEFEIQDLFGVAEQHVARW